MGIDHAEQYANRLMERLKAEAVPENQEAMEAYMKNQFHFLGIRTPERKQILKDFIKESGYPETPEDLKKTVIILFQSSFREYAYAGLDLLIKRKKHLHSGDLTFLEKLILTKPWWDTVDLLASHIAGYLLSSEPASSTVTEQWVEHESIWMKRTALLFQLKYKDQTDSDKLGRIICRLSDSNEFFLQKAIGWALREYSKTNPEWVIQFTAQNELKPLSKKEALKIISRQQDFSL
ncbi:DNA alkylation repair protein [Metabacillus sp. 113a]|uniref:DNA alkylation repair protein n=2 Tax=unclassified Metabacillus TaxID=2675274 RepID=UPI003CF9AA48